MHHHPAKTYEDIKEEKGERKEEDPVCDAIESDPPPMIPKNRSCEGEAVGEREDDDDYVAQGTIPVPAMGFPTHPDSRFELH